MIYSIHSKESEKTMEVKISGLYKVTVIEYDQGVQRSTPDYDKYYTTEAEAKAYAHQIQTIGNSDCYYRATVERI
jgi:hypothetical protein